MLSQEHEALGVEFYLSNDAKYVFDQAKYYVVLLPFY